MWTDRRILELFNIDIPLIQAPMAGAVSSELVIGVSEAGGLGSLPCAMLSPDQIRTELGIIRQRTSRPINLNFFCHQPPAPDLERERRWKERLENYYLELGVDPLTPTPPSVRNPFDETACEIIEEFRPEVVSFHFGLPPAHLLDRVRDSGAKILSSATSVAEACWLEAHGCHAIIAQGFEAGGHRGMFLTSDLSTQMGTMALVPQVVDAVSLPVIAAGGIGDARGIAAAFVLGASAVQLGTAFLFCPEAKVSAIHRQALRASKDNPTALTNVFTGRPARSIVNRLVREVGPISALAPAFPLAGGALAPLKGAAEERGSGDFSALWSGQAAALAREMPAGELTRKLASEALGLLSG